MSMVKWVGGVGLFAVLIAVIPLTAQQKQKLPVTPVARPIPVKVNAIRLAPGYQTRRQFTGTLEAKRQAELSFVRSGLVQEVLVDEGASVTRGQIVARLDTRELEARRSRLQAQLARAQARLLELERGPRREPRRGAEAEVRRLRSELELARSKQARRQHLYEDGAIPREDLEEFNSRVRVLEESLEAARQSSLELENGTRPEVLQQAQAEVAAARADLASLEVEVQDSVLLAPFRGRVLARHLDEGTVVNPGTRLLLLGETESLEARISLPQGQKYPPSTQLDLGGRRVSAQLIGTTPKVDPASNTLVVRYRVREGLPGQPVTLNLEETVREPGYWIPTVALTSAGNGLWQCYTVGTDQTVQVQRLEVLHRETHRILVRGTLQSGDQVIVEGVGQVVPGQKVASQGLNS